jgi:hypothetical protein
MVLLSQSAVAIHRVLDIHADANRAGIHDNSDARPCQICQSLHNAAPAPVLALLELATPHAGAPPLCEPPQVESLLAFSLSIRPPPLV